MATKWPRTLVQAAWNIDDFWEWEDAKKGIFRCMKRREELLNMKRRKRNKRGNYE